MPAPTCAPAPAPGREGRSGRSRGERAALIASTVVVLATVLAQAPGRIVPETKLDLVLDPVRYLGRALSAWDPSAGFGRVQNQAAGYLFPMGPFYAVGDLLHLPPWLVQRLWITLVIVTALWGAHRLATLVGVASAPGRVVVAWAYALAPATVGVAAFQSAGQLPYALAPWVLVPLVGAVDGDRPRRVAARSALAVALMGGVNGASAVAVLPLALAWFAARTPGPDRRRLAAWWVGALAAATLWWVVPLLVSVRYGLNFTDFTETAGQTTGTESAIEVLRGTGNWLGYLYGPDGYWLPGARDLTVVPWAVVGSTVVAAAGLAGLARRDAPGRRWLLPAALVGAVLLGVGYDGPFSGSFAGPALDLLDGPLAPLRNVHKFSAVLRLPLALGLGHLVTVAGSRLARTRPPAPASLPASTGRRRPAPTVLVALAAPVLALGAIVAAIAPLTAGRATAPGSFEELPAAWHDAAAWLDAHDDDGRALVIPGSTFGEYRWGRPLDEPLGALARSDWAVRDLIPLGGIGSTRVLDGIDRALQGDALPPGFVATLQRAGVRHLVVRNDLDRKRTGGPSPATVRRLLTTAEGLEVVASFGEHLAGAEGEPDGRLGPRPGTEDADPVDFREVDVWSVPPADGGAVGGGDPRVAAYPADGALVVGGGPEALLQLPPKVTAGRATVLAVDEPAAGLGGVIRVATDTARRRDVAFGTIRDNVTATLTAEQRSPRSGLAPTNLWPADAPIGLTVAEVEGAATLDDSDPIGPVTDPEHQPYAAFDDDTATTWVPWQQQEGEWVGATFDEPRELGSVRVRIPSLRGRRIGSVTISTDATDRTVPVDATGTATAEVDGATSTVRVAIASIVEGTDLGPVGLSEVAFDELTVRRPLVAAPVQVGSGDGPGAASVASFERSRRDRYDAERTDEEGRLDRRVTLDGSGPFRLSGTASIRPGANLDQLFDGAHLVLRGGRSTDPSQAVTATASSRWRDLPALAALAATDGDPATAWVSAPEETAPELALSWTGRVQIDGLVLHDLTGGLDPVTQVTVLVGDARYERRVPADGRISFPAVEADRLVLSFPGRTGDAAERRVGVSEVEVPALADRPTFRYDVEAEIDLPCGQGPDLAVDGATVATTARPTVGELVRGAPVAWEACDPLDLAAGDRRFDASPAGILAVDRLLVEPADGLDAAPRPRSLEVVRWDGEHRRVAVGAGAASIVATSENYNEGWTATLDGVEVPSIRVDGWRQGWVVPAGDAGDLVLAYGPGRIHRAGLALGVVALLVLVVGAVHPGRRRRADPPWMAPADRPAGERSALALAVVVGVALGGPLVLALIPLLVLPRRARWLPALGAAACGLAGAIVLRLPPAEFGTDIGALSGGPQVAAVVALLALAAGGVPVRAPASSSARPGGVGGVGGVGDPSEGEGEGEGDDVEGAGAPGSDRSG